MIYGLHQFHDYRSPLLRREPGPAALCPDRADPTDARPRMRYASPAVDPRVEHLDGFGLDARLDPYMPQGTAILRAITDSDLDVGGAIPLRQDFTVGSMLDDLRAARDRVFTEPYRWDPPILSPAAYAWAVEHGHIHDPRATCTITSVTADETPDEPQEPPRDDA